MANQTVKTVRGVLQAVKQNTNNRYGVKLDDIWYDGFGTCLVEKGETVEVNFTEKNGYNNIVTVFSYDQDSTYPGVEELSPSEYRMQRCVALKCAVQLPGVTTVEKAERTAEKLQEWLNAAPEISGGNGQQ